MSRKSARRKRQDRLSGTTAIPKPQFPNVDGRSNQTIPLSGDFQARLENKLRDILGSDLRSLAAFRMSLAILILLDLVDRAGDLRAHYTDWGVLPRGALIDLFLHPHLFSFHFMNGTWPWQLLLFLLTALFAIGLFIGYRTRLMTVACWLLLVSLQNRNPFVLQGGDTLLRMSLFWAIFLPLGARWSLDRHVARTSGGIQQEERQSVITWATAAVLTQVVLVYVCAAILKTGPEWTRDYTAVYYAMSVDHLTTPLGHWLLRHPDLMKALTYVTVKIELFAPLLFFVPRFTAFFRFTAIALLLGMQLGFGATIRIYLFPWICGCATLPMLPSAFWEKLPHAVQFWSGLGSVERTATRLFRWLPSRPPSGASLAFTPRWLNVTAAFFLAYVILWNLGTLPVSFMSKRVEVPQGLHWIGLVLRIDQRWDMFAPGPLKDDGWYVIPGTLLDGKEVDVFQHGAPVTWEKPEFVAYTYKNQRWQRYMVNLWNRDLSEFREFYGKYLCRSWNAAHQGGAQLDRFTIYFMREYTLPDGEEAPRRITLWKHQCFKMPAFADPREE